MGHVQAGGSEPHITVEKCREISEFMSSHCAPVVHIRQGGLGPRHLEFSQRAAPASISPSKTLQDFRPFVAVESPSSIDIDIMLMQLMLRSS